MIQLHVDAATVATVIYMPLCRLSILSADNDLYKDRALGPTSLR